MSPRAPPGWGAPGPSSASSCGCGCRALPRSSTLTAGMSAGRCHGGPYSCPSNSRVLSAAPGGHRPSVLPRTEICTLALCGCRDWGGAGERGWGAHGHLGHPDAFSRGYFSCTPTAQGNGGMRERWQNFHRVPGGKRRRSKTKRAFGADVPSALLLQCLSRWSRHQRQCLLSPSLRCLFSELLAKL